MTAGYCWPVAAYKKRQITFKNAKPARLSIVTKIPVAYPDLTETEEAHLLDAFRSSWISSTGKYIDQFEEQFATACEAKSAVTVCNGTVALHLALLALGVRPGDEILVPSLTFVATANACRYVGAEPVFVDVDPNTWCIDPKLIENAVTRRTKGIIPVHLYGHPADMDEINRLAAIHGLWVVEDAAEAHFATYRGRTVGSLAPIATFSFYGNKILTSGEGGALTVADRALEKRVRTLRGQGMDPSRRYFFPVTGYNFRLTNLAAAILCGQLERREQILGRRRQIYAEYSERLREIPGIALQPIAPWAEVAPWLFCITVTPEFGRSRDELAAILDGHGIESRPFFIPVHRLPPFRDDSAARREILPVTDQLSDQGMNLPTYAGMTTETIDRVVTAVARARR